MTIKAMGQGAFRLQTGPGKRLQEAIVADIEDDVLLGYDVLGNAESSADIIIRWQRNTLYTEKSEANAKGNCCRRCASSRELRSCDRSVCGKRRG